MSLVLSDSVLWKKSDSFVEYDKAIGFMESHIVKVRDGVADEMVWLLEHPPLYTAGTSAKDGDLIDSNRFPVYETGRGGQYTYHGPGQRVAYVMLNLKRRASLSGDAVPDIRKFVQRLELWLINTLARFGIDAGLRDGRIGVWVEVPRKGDCKIGALGIRIRQGVTYHGVSLNVNPDLSHFSGIVPCGISQYGVTSMYELGVDVAMEEVDKVLKEEFCRLF